MTEEQEPGWERRILEKIALEGLAEQKRRRRWGIFFKLLGFFMFGLVIWVVGDFGDSDTLSEGAQHTALVNIEGEIGASNEASAQRVVEALQRAFDDRGTKGVVVRINSPGGSPVQAGMINDEMQRLRKLHSDVPLYVVVEDICASGGYYIAAAADRIYVDKASIVGSIGVLMEGFGFTGTMNKLGVERRLLTAGENKGFLDPFSPQQPRQIEHAKLMLEDIHRQFVDVVRKGRGKRLKETPDMFSGLMWTGEKSIALGLADGFGTVDSVARDVIGAKDVRDYTQRQSFTERFAQRFGTEVAGRVMNSLGRIAVH